MRKLLTRGLLPLFSMGAVSLLAISTARADGFDLAANVESALNGGSFGLALGLIFVGGLLTSLTPCVYPMMAITVAVFGAHEAKSKTRAALLSTMYVLGICGLFVPLGLVAGLGGGMFAEHLSKPYVVFPMAILFLALSASMFGAFELNLPPRLQNKLNQVGGVGPLGAFLLGLVMALIAAPCVGPVLSALLTWIATTRDAALGGAAMLSYALGVGLLTWIVGTFAVGMPKSGRWLEWVKSFFGMVMVGAAFWYVRDFIGLGHLVERTPWYLGTGLIMVAAGLGLGAIHLSYHGASLFKRVRKTGGVVLAVAGGLMAMLWFNAAPQTESVVLADGRELTEIEWVSDYDTARQRALDEGRPLLVDFGASWCGACGELERHTFTNPEVIQESQRFIAVRIDLSPGEDVAAGRRILTERYAQRGLPLVVLHNADGSESHRVTGFMEPEPFLDRMQATQ